MRISHSDKKTVVISMGDPAGIGPEVTLKALKKLKHAKARTFIVVGDYEIFQKTAKILRINISSFYSKASQYCKTKSPGIYFVDLKNVNLKNFRFGKSNKATGASSMEYLKAACDIVKMQAGCALVTAPINKSSINKAGFNFPGHTEYLRSLTKNKNVTMMLAGGPLKLSLVSRHVAFRDVPRYITKKRIIETIENTNLALKKYFKIKNPKIGIASLNPHAGDDGLFGKEERRVIKPAVDYLKRKIKGLVGPEASDTLFYKAFTGKLDAIVCMYHDQGLIPLKMIAFETGVNLTIGLPFMRTSPDHGTAFDIAGKGKANPSSMIEAIKLAIQLC